MRPAHNTKVNVAIGFILLIAAAFSAGQTTRPAEPKAQAAIDDILSGLATNDGPGCACAVVSGGKVAASGAVGYASIEHRGPMGLSTPVYVGSIAKQFIAAVALKLHDRGALDLDARIRELVPEFPDYARDVSGRHLLTHTSGIRDYLQLSHHAGGGLFESPDDGRVLQQLSRQRRLDFPAGTESQYSNSNYFLLEMMIERATDRELSDIADELILAPTEMSSSLFLKNYLEVVPGRARGYHKLDEAHYELHEPMPGTSGLLTTVNDLVRWAQFLRDGAITGDATIKSMTTPGILTNGTVTPEGAGLRIETKFGRRVIQHSGSNRGFNGHFSWYPEDDVFVVMLCNFREARATTLANRIAERLFDAQQPKSKRSLPTIEDESLAILEPFAGTFEPVAGRGAIEIEIEAPHAVLTLYGNHPSASSTGSNLLEEADQHGVFSVSDLPTEGRIGVSRSSDGPAVTLMINGRGAATFVPSAPLSPSDFQSLVGTYQSQELKVRYRLVVRDENLDVEIERCDGTIVRRGSLHSVTRRFFIFSRDPVTNLQFILNKNGAATGFLLSEPRLREVVFNRVDA